MPRHHAGQSWWKYVPPGKRSTRELEIFRLRALNLLQSRRFWFIASLALYLAGCVLLLSTFAPGLALLALAPAALLPILGYLVYWLIWKEFHE
jgi:hypothetical protein